VSAQRVLSSRLLIRTLVFCVTLFCSGNTLRAIAACAAPVFSVAQTYAVGTTPRSIAFGDFNADGRIDLAVANQSSNNVSVLLNIGGGNFSTPTNFAVGGQPFSIVVADFNADGKSDLAAAHFSSNNVSILLGTGTGSFGAPTAASAGDNARALATGDFNGDAKADLVVGRSSSLAVLLGSGTGSFGAPTVMNLSGDPTAVIVADFNHDGKSDLAATTNSGSTYRVAVLLGTGTGSFGAASNFTVGGLPISLAAGHFNSDSALDLAVATIGGGNVSILLGTGTGSFSAATGIALELGSRSVAVGDFNADGKSDLAVTVSGDSLSASGYVSILPGNGDGTFGTRTNYGAGRVPHFVGVADLDGDTRSDLAVANAGSFSSDEKGDISILFGNAGGTFSAAVRLISSGPRALVNGDFNADGKIDIAAMQTNSVGVFLGTGLGTFTGPTNFPFTGFPDAMAGGDFNGDGKKDLVVTTQSPNGVNVFLGTGTGGFTGPTVFSAGSIPYGIGIGDFNADGKNDLAVANPGSNNISILLGDGAGSFSGPTNVALGNAGPESVAVGDYNADGKTDLAIGNSATFVSILLGTGTGSFTGPTNFAAGQTPEAIVTGDFNADGKADLATANRVSSSVNILLGNGNGTFGSPTAYIVGGNPFDLEIGDFNGDGKADLAVPNYSLNRVSIMQGTGTGTFVGPVYYSTGVQPHGVAVEDYNGDGHSDVATADLNSSTITVLLNGCSGAATTLPTLSINDVSVTEGNEGATGSATFTVSLSAASSQTVMVSYATFALLPAFGSSYQPASGTLIFAPGETTKPINITINGDNLVESNELFFISLSNPINAAILDGQGTGTIVNDDVAQTVQFGQATYTVSEGANFINISVTRSGDSSAPATVKYSTSDTTDANFRCDPSTPGQFTGVASRKCDYHIAVGKLRFAAGETTKQLTLSIVNDVYTEGPETFNLTLTNAIGFSLGQNRSVPITITDDDAAGAANPIDNTSFFVRQLYVDLLSREPDPAGWSGWTSRIDLCGQPGQPPPPCDRVTVGGDGFLRSGEFFDRQFFVLRLYRTGLGRILRYDDVGDLAFVSGFLTAEQLELNKQDLVAEIMGRAEFFNVYIGLNDTQFVDTLLQTAAITVAADVRQGWITALGGSTKTRAQVFREISERPEVSNKYLHEAQVVSAYYGFFTRNPDGAYLNYLQRLDNGEINLADLANAFINAQEYRQRFGP
jgi:Calx-beta domain/FG-GAP-like repeat